MRDDQITFRLAQETDMVRVKELMDRVKQNMEHPDWYITDELPWLLRHVSAEGFTVLAEVKSEDSGESENGQPRLVAFFTVDLPGVRELSGGIQNPDQEVNLGIDAGFDAEKRLLVAHLDSVAVDPEFRGHHLQGRLVEKAERELSGRIQKFWMCTVHPDNHASLYSMQRHGYRIIATKEKYGGTLRHILLKEKNSVGTESAEEKEKSETVTQSLPLTDPIQKKRPAVLVSACLLGSNCRYNEKGVLDENVRSLMEVADLIPICPEIYGGLSTPRVPSERVGDLVKTKAGSDVTPQYQKGAREAWKLAELFSCTCAVLKERSPSCGHGQIYDGTYSGKLTAGNGVTAELLLAHGIPVFGESETEECLIYLKNRG